MFLFMSVHTYVNILVNMFVFKFTFLPNDSENDKNLYRSDIDFYIAHFEKV